MADAKAIRQVKSIVEADPARRFVIVSAPGKRFKDDIKITDMLYRCYNEVVEKGTCKESFSIIRQRFAEIVKDLGADSLDVVEMLMSLEEEFKVTVPEEDAVNVKTVGDIVKVIESNK